MAAHCLWQMPAIEHFHAAISTRIADARKALAVLDGDAAGREVGYATSAVDDDRLTPVIKRHAPRVAGAHVVIKQTSELQGARSQAQHAGLVQTRDPPWRFHARLNAVALAEEQLAIRAPHKGVDGLMCVASAKAAENDTAFIGHTVVIHVAQKNKFLTGAHVHAAVAGFHAGGDVEAVSKDSRLIRVAIAVGVGELDDFIIGNLAGAQVWIGPGACHIHAAFGVPTHRQWISNAEFLRCEKIHHKPFGRSKGFLFVSRVQNYLALKEGRLRCECGLGSASGNGGNLLLCLGN